MTLDRGTVVLVDLPANGSNPTHLVIGGGKDGTLYLLNRDKMGGLGDSNAWQTLDLTSGLFSTGDVGSQLECLTQRRRELGRLRRNRRSSEFSADHAKGRG